MSIRRPARSVEEACAAWQALLGPPLRRPAPATDRSSGGGRQPVAWNPKVLTLQPDAPPPKARTRTRDLDPPRDAA